MDKNEKEGAKPKKSFLDKVGEKIVSLFVGESIDFSGFLGQVKNLLAENEIDAQDMLDIFKEYDDKHKKGKFSEHVKDLHDMILFDLLLSIDRYNTVGVIWLYAKFLQ